MKVKSSLVALGLLLGLATSCQKEDIKVQQPQSQTQGQAVANRSLSLSDCSPENRENPLDSVGLYHNLAVEYVEANASNGTLAEAVALSNKYTVRTFGPRIPDIESQLPSEESIRVRLNDSTSWFSATIERLRCSAACKERLVQLNTIVREHVSANPTDYCSLKNAIVEFEAVVMSTEVLSDIERAEVLKAASVARYSAYHWMGRYGAEGRSAKAPTLAQKKWWEWAIIIGADIAGGYFGGPGGASGCSVAANTILG